MKQKLVALSLLGIAAVSAAKGRPIYNKDCKVVPLMVVALHNREAKQLASHPGFWTMPEFDVSQDWRSKGYNPLKPEDAVLLMNPLSISEGSLYTMAGVACGPTTWGIFCSAKLDLRLAKAPKKLADGTLQADYETLYSFHDKRGGEKARVEDSIKKTLQNTIRDLPVCERAK